MNMEVAEYCYLNCWDFGDDFVNLDFTAGSMDWDNSVALVLGVAHNSAMATMVGRVKSQPLNNIRECF